MLDMIETVLGAVATKDIVPVLTHIHVTPEGVQGSNGRLSIHYPGKTPVDRELCLPGRKLQQALKKGKEPKWSTTEQSLTLSSGRLRVRLPINPAPYPVTHPSDSNPFRIADPVDFINTLRTLRPVVAQDGSRPWACGVLVKGASMYATNNVVLVRAGWQGLDGAGLPGVNVPMDAVDELVRLNKAGHTPATLRVDDNSLTVTFDTGVWLRTSLLNAEWPDADAMIGELPTEPPYGGELLADLQSGVDAVVPFSADERAPVVEIGEHGMRTREGDVQAEVALEGLPAGAYRAEVLSLVLSAAEGVWFDDYPKPVRFVGGDLAGVFAGVRA
jgi:DNA polymerase III sliding clamp (beta) subunit (PCNA family)